MGWFFHRTEEEPARGRRAASSTDPKDLDRHMATFRQHGCAVCPLNARESTLQHPKMAPTGAARPLLFILGENPGREEDHQGKQFVGPSGQLLRSSLPPDWLDSKIRWDNATRCFVGSPVRAPSAVEVACCRGYVEKAIADSRPRVVLGVGGVPLAWALAHDQGIFKWRGRWVPLRVGDHACWFVPILHPSFILRRQDEQVSDEDLGEDSEKATPDELKRLFTRDLAGVIDRLRTDTLPPLPNEWEHQTEGITVVLGRSSDDLNLIERTLRRWATGGPKSIDIEATALRPYAAGAKIVSVGISTGVETISFPIDHPQAWPHKGHHERAKELLKRFIQAPVVKIAHKLSFEEEWFGYTYGTEILDTAWGDTMAQAHVLDERENMLDLDTLILHRFGFRLKALSPTVDRSKVLAAPLPDLLLYGGLDAKYEFKLYEVQEAELQSEPRLQGVVDELVKTNKTLAKAQLLGITPDRGRMQTIGTTLQRDIDALTDKIQARPEIITFTRRTGHAFNPDSDKDMETLFRHMLGRTEGIQANGRWSANKVVLTRMTEAGLPLASLITQRREVAVVKRTFVDSIADHLWPDGKIHTTFNPYGTRTGRLSSSGPNLQNQPRRHHKEVRGIYAASPGHVLVSADYSQIEARMLGIVSEDKTFCEAFWADYDVHMDWAKKVLHMHPECAVLVEGWDGKSDPLADPKVLKDFRSIVKNTFVFPLFYGAGVPKICGMMRLPESKGKILRDEFWQVFSGIRRWQERQVEFYDTHGYIETLTGRRRRGPLSRPDLFNSVPQGTAGIMVLNAMGRLSDMGYQAILNIHDDLTFDLPIDGLDEHVSAIGRAMVLCDYAWVTVPLAVEIQVGLHWGEQELVGVIQSTEFGWPKRPGFLTDNGRGT